LALNGAEVVYRGLYPHPATGNELFEIRAARAPRQQPVPRRSQHGYYYLNADSDIPTTPLRPAFIIDYRGRIVGPRRLRRCLDLCGRRHRHRSDALSSRYCPVGNWLKDSAHRTLRPLYKDPIYPKNLYLEREPMKHQEYRREVIEKQIALMHQRSI